MLQQVGKHWQGVWINLLSAFIAGELVRQLNTWRISARHQVRPPSGNLFPTGNLIHCAAVRVVGGLLDCIAHTVLDCRADFQNAVRTPLLNQPVEAAKLIAGNINLRQARTVLPEPAQAKPLDLLRAVIHRNFADDVRQEVAELLVIAAVAALHFTVKTAIHDFEGFGITGVICFIFFHSITFLILFFSG